MITPPEGEEEELIDLPEDVKIQSVAVVSAARASEIEQQILGEQERMESTDPVLYRWHHKHRCGHHFARNARAM